MTSTDQAALVPALRRIAELENELAIHDRTAALLGDVVSQRWSEAIAVTAGEGLPVQLTIRVLGVSESGYCEWRGLSVAMIMQLGR